MKELIDKLRKFRNDRNWAKYHTPRNLAEAISIESAELLKCFIWGKKDTDWAGVMDEIADVAIFLLYLCDYMEVDLKTVIERKIAINAEKYQVGESHEW